MIPNKEDVIIFSDAAYKFEKGLASFGFMMMLNGSIMDVCAVHKSWNLLLQRRPK